MVLDKLTVVDGHIGLTPVIMPLVGIGLTAIVCDAVALQPVVVPVTVYVAVVVPLKVTVAPVVALKPADGAQV